MSITGPCRECCGALFVGGTALAQRGVFIAAPPVATATALGDGADVSAQVAAVHFRHQVDRRDFVDVE